MGLTIYINNKDNTAKILPLIKELKIYDSEGVRRDYVRMTLFNPNDNLVLPQGEQMRIIMDDVEMGTYTLNQARQENNQFIVTADVTTASLKVKKHRSFNDTTLGEIINKIATDNGLIPAIADNLSVIPIETIIQRETDLNLITRLGLEYNALAKVSAGRLVFIPKDGKSRSGKVLPTISHTISGNDKPKITHYSHYKALQLKTQGQAEWRAGFLITLQNTTFIIQQVEHTVAGASFSTKILGQTI